jgi:hypothetical protein
MKDCRTDMGVREQKDRRRTYFLRTYSESNARLAPSSIWRTFREKDFVILSKLGR